MNGNVRKYLYRYIYLILYLYSYSYFRYTRVKKKVRRDSIKALLVLDILNFSLLTLAIVLDQFSQIPFANATTQFFIIISIIGLLICSSYIAPQNDDAWRDGIPRKIFLTVYIILLIFALNLSGGDSHAGYNINAFKFWIAMVVVNLDLIKRLFDGESDMNQNTSH